MTDRPELARSATDLLAERIDEPRAASPAARAAAIAAGRAAMAAMKRSRRRRVVAALALAASVVLAIGVGVTRRSPPTAHVPSPTIVVQIAKTVGSVQISSASGTLTAGDRVVVGADGSALLTVSTGTHVTVDGGGDLSVISTGAEQTFSLRAGSARFDVAKVAAGERFIVRTMDSVIEVRGTAFDVSVQRPDPTCTVATSTRLRVREGVVIVRAQGRETVVSAGGTWPAECATPSVVSPEPITSATPTASPAATASQPKAVPSGTALTEQNALFSDAAAAKKRGDRATALQLYDRLLTKYPASSLAESATVERMRLLTGPARSAAARAYLAKYPKGFARAEAMKIAVGAE